MDVGTEYLLKALIETKGEVFALKRINTELLLALKTIDLHWTAGNFSREPGMWEKMRAAIQKAQAVETKTQGDAS